MTIIKILPKIIFYLIKRFVLSKKKTSLSKCGFDKLNHLPTGSITFRQAVTFQRKINPRKYDVLISV